MAFMDFLDPAGLFGDDPDFMDILAGGKASFAARSSDRPGDHTCYPSGGANVSEARR